MPELDNHSQQPVRFGGCRQLLGQYQIIGTELERLETTAHRFRSQLETSALRSFQQSLSFVPTEVLRAYREDLLDPDIVSAELFIHRGGRAWRMPAVVIGGIAIALAIGLGLASAGASFLFSFSVAFLLAAPFVIAWQYAPREAMIRRLRFAHWLSKEIERRGGGSSIRSRVGRAGSYVPHLWSPYVGNSAASPL
jgi:hypothetical protein